MTTIILFFVTLLVAALAKAVADGIAFGGHLPTWLKGWIDRDPKNEHPGNPHLVECVSEESVLSLFRMRRSAESVPFPMRLRRRLRLIQRPSRRPVPWCRARFMPPPRLFSMISRCPGMWAFECKGRYQLHWMP